MSERAIKYLLMVALLVNGALALASLRRTEQLLERAVPKWENSIPETPSDATTRLGVVSGAGTGGASRSTLPVPHVHTGEVISAAWANSLVDEVNSLEERCPKK